MARFVPLQRFTQLIVSYALVRISGVSSKLLRHPVSFKQEQLELIQQL